MREPDRIHRILNKLMEYWALYPEIRLGQILHNSYRKTYPIFHLEDDLFEAWLNKELRKAEIGYIDSKGRYVMRDKDCMKTKEQIYED